MLKTEPTTSILDQGRFPFYSVSENGIEFHANTTREEWLKVVEQLTAMHESSGRLHFRAICILADALNFGEQAYGEDYAQAIDETRKWMQISAKTIHNAMWVMKQIPATRRRELLSLSHHAEVASLEPQEQDELLAMAERENMTVAELRKTVSDRHPKTKRGKERKAKSTAAAAISNMTEAKTAATLLSNYLTEHEDKIKPGPLLEVMGHISKLFRRITDKGRKLMTEPISKPEVGSIVIYEGKEHRVTASMFTPARDSESGWPELHIETEPVGQI